MENTFPLLFPPKCFMSATLQRRLLYLYKINLSTFTLTVASNEFVSFFLPVSVTLSTAITTLVYTVKSNQTPNNKTEHYQYFQALRVYLCVVGKSLWQGDWLALFRACLSELVLLAVGSLEDRFLSEKQGFWWTISHSTLVISHSPGPWGGDPCEGPSLTGPGNI